MPSYGTRRTGLASERHDDSASLPCRARLLLGEQRADCIRAVRPGQQVPLDDVAPEVAQHRELLGGLDALADRLQPELAASARTPRTSASTPGLCGMALMYARSIFRMSVGIDSRYRNDA